MRLVDETGTSFDPADMRDQLATSGIVFIEDGDLSAVVELVLSFSQLYRHPHEDSPGITRIRATSSASMTCRPERRAFSRDSLRLHTDRATVATPPTLVVLLTVQAPTQGGEVLMVDLAPALHRLAGLPDFGEICRSAVLVSADQHRPILEEMGSKGYRFRYRDDPIARPRLLNSLGRPVLEELRRMHAAPRVIKMRAGDGYIVHNHRYLHGRRSFIGNREVVRILAMSDIPLATVQVSRAHGG